MGVLCCVTDANPAEPDIYKTIDYKKWKKVREEKNIEKKKQMLKPIFNIIDKDKNGFITRDELRAFWVAIVNKDNYYFFYRKHGQFGNNNYDHEAKQVADLDFLLMDMNNDKKITFKELLNFMT